MSKSLANGFFWSAIDRFAVVVVQILIEIVLARLLLPADYGLIGMVAVFIAIAQVFTDGGFLNALIQKQDRSETDYGTVFLTGLVLGLVLYVILYFTAPLIAAFYHVDILTMLVRVLGLNIIFNSLTTVFRAKLTVEMNFRRQALFSLISISVSGVLGYWLALRGTGVWALVAQLVSFYGFNTLFLLLGTGWFPVLKFSKTSFQSLFGFGSRLLLASLVQAIYMNLYNLLIGKIFRQSELGIYQKSTQFTLYPAGMLTNMIQRVMFPFLSGFQDDDAKLSELNKQYYTVVAMIFFPLFFGLSMLAEPFVRIFLTDTWIAAVPVIRILSIAFLFYPLININMYVFQIKGLSGRFLSIEVLTKISGIIILIVTLQYDMVVVSVGILVQQVIHLLVSAYYADKLLKKRPFAQFGLLLPLFVFSIVISLLNNYVMEMISDVWLKFFSGFLIILVSYGFYYLVFNKDEMKMLVGVFRKKGSV